MSRFSHALTTALQDLGWTQLELANRTRLAPSQINKYVRGKLEPGAGALETICREFPEGQRANVVAAWLRDAVPQSASGLLAILTPGRTADLQAESVGELSREVDQAVRYLTDMARRHTEISDLLVDLAKALQGPAAR